MIEFRKGGYTQGTNPSEIPFSTSLNDDSYLNKASKAAQWVGETAYGGIKKAVKSAGVPGQLLETAGESISKRIPEPVKNVLSKPSEFMEEYFPLFKGEDNEKAYPTPEGIENKIIKPIEQFAGIPEGYGENQNNKVQNFITDVAGALPLTILGVSTLPKAIASAIGSEVGSRTGGFAGKVAGSVAGHPEAGEAIGSIAGSIAGGGLGVGTLKKGQNIGKAMSRQEGLINKAKAIPGGWKYNSLRNKITQNIEEGFGKANSEYKIAPEEWKKRDATNVWDAIKEVDKDVSKNTMLREKIGKTLSDVKDKFLPSKESVEKQAAEESKAYKLESSSREKELINAQRDLVSAQRESKKASATTARTIAPANQKEVTKERVQSLKTLGSEKSKTDQEFRKLRTQYTKAKKQEELMMQKGRVGIAAQKRSEYKKAKTRADELEKKSLSQQEKITKIKEDIKQENISREEEIKKIKSKARENLEKSQDTLFNLKKTYKKIPKIERQPTSEDIRFGKKEVNLDELIDARRTVGHNMKQTYGDVEAHGKLKFLYKKISEEIEKAAKENPNWGEPFMDSTAAYDTINKKHAIDYLLHPEGKYTKPGIAAATLAFQGLPALGKLILGYGVGHLVAEPIRYTTWALNNPTIRKEVDKLASAAMAIQLNPKHMNKEHIATAVRALKIIGHETKNIEKTVNYNPEFRKGGFIQSQT